MIYTVLFIILLIVLIYIFAIYPIILFFQCLFDSTISGVSKFLVFLLSFILFPLPSFFYGAFSKKSLLSRILLGLYGLIFVMAIIAVIVGSMAGGSKIIQTAVKNYGGIAGDFIGVDFEELTKVKIEEAEPKFKGRNNYSKKDVQVFESGRNARDLSIPPQPQPINNTATDIPSSPLYKACMAASSNPKLAQGSCECVRDGFGKNETIQTLLADRNDADKAAIENQAVQIYSSIANRDAAAMQSIKAQIQTNPVMKDAVLVVMTLTKSCAPPPVAVESPLVPLPVAPE